MAKTIGELLDPAEMPAMPHVDLTKVWKFGVGKAREFLGADTAERLFPTL